jgi:hypothetical protein
MLNSQKSISHYLLISITTFVVGTGFGYLIAYLSGLNPSLIPLISAVIGLVVAFSIPVWQTYFVNAPKLSVDINAIKRTVSDSAVTSIDDDPELSPLKPLKDTVSYYPSEDVFLDMVNRERPKSTMNGYTLSELEDMLARAKQRLRDLPTQIEERKKDLDTVKSFTPATLSKYECEKLNRPLNPEVEFNSDDPDNTLKELQDAYQKRLEIWEKYYANIQTNLPSTERKIDQIKNNLIANRSFFTVSASLINSGRFNTAVKVPALLRVSIGEGNYIDLKLTLKDFENKSEISANGTRIVIFESSEVSSLPEEDRKLINTYWGQSVSSRLLLEDIH